MNKINSNFEGQTIFFGMDVHKSSWNLGIHLNDMFVKNVHQKPNPAVMEKSTSCLPEQSAECRIKKLIICSFAHRNWSARTADHRSTNADVFSVCPTCAKPLVSCSRMLINSFKY